MNAQNAFLLLLYVDKTWGLIHGKYRELNANCTAASPIFVQYYRCMLKLGLAVVGIIFDLPTN